MRPYEYDKSHGPKHLSDLLEANSRSLGLLCAFGKKRLWGSRHLYNYDDLQTAIKSTCDTLHLNLNVVGTKQNSLDWMDEVLRVILASHHIVVDVTLPKPNVLYELGIACSLRCNRAVTICKHKNVSFPCSEVQQLQLLQYESYEDLQSKLKDHLGKINFLSQAEHDAAFESLHDILNPSAMFVLFLIVENRLKHVKLDHKVEWHMSWQIDQSGDAGIFNHTNQLMQAGLVRFAYDKAVKPGGMAWALHPTEMGKLYMKSRHFLQYFFPEEQIKEIQNQL